MEDKINNRVFYLDLARGVAIFFMIMQHCILVHETTHGEGNAILGNLFLVSGTAPAAPVFLLIMGIFIAKSRASMKEGLMKGLKLLLMAYLLNILRFTFPLLIGVSVGEVSLHEVISMSFVVDIFQVAGLSFLLLSLLKNIPHQQIVLIIISISVLLLSPYLWGINDHMLTQPLWGMNEETVFFPFFPWGVYPMLGMAFSDVFISLNKKKMCIHSIVIATILITLGFLTYEIFPVGDYYSRTGASLHFFIIGFVFLWFPACYQITKRLDEKNMVFTILYSWSKNVTSIYCVQWILFGWSMLVFGMNEQTAIVAVIIGLSVLVATHYLVKMNTIRKLFSWI